MMEPRVALNYLGLHRKGLVGIMATRNRSHSATQHTDAFYGSKWPILSRLVAK
jgi:hypothetical protein